MNENKTINYEESYWNLLTEVKELNEQIEGHKKQLKFDSVTLQDQAKRIKELEFVVMAAKKHMKLFSPVTEALLRMAIDKAGCLNDRL